MIGNPDLPRSNDWKPRLADLWDFRGTMVRTPFLIWASILCTLKIFINLAWLPESATGSRMPFAVFFHVLNSHPGMGLKLPPGDLLALCLSSIPFVWAGLVLTVRRLRSSGLHPAWSVCFFIPFAKFILFASLAALPPAGTERELRRPGWMGRLIPAGRSCAFVSALLTAVVGVAFVGLATKGFGSYGYALFLGLPFFFGMTTSLLYGFHQPRDIGSCMAVTTLSLLLACGLLILMLMEGAICLVMAAPFAFVAGLLGTLVGWLVQKTYWDAHGDRTASLAMIVLMLPGAMSLEAILPVPNPLHEVTTAIEIAAPPETVWRNVVTFPDLPPPAEWIFRTGLAYPTRAVIDGRGTGAIRRCCFSTGDFIEPITVWDEPRTLGFSVTRNPPPMSEWNPFGRVDAPHLHGFMVSERGQFHLVDLGNGRTRLEGTTWYRHGLQPAGYWRLWSDFIIHRIHDRVLTHVKNHSESSPAGS